MAAAAFGLAFAPAVANAQEASQQITDSAGAAQVGTTEVAPAVAAHAPVTANAPITVASPDSGGDASNSGGTTASSSGGGGSSSGGSSADQDVSGSAGAAQVGSGTVSPAAAADAPVTANAPITVLSPDSGGDASQSGGSEATASGDRGTGGGDQEATESAGSAQVGSAGLSPDAAVAAPVTANAPVTIASPDSGGEATGSGGTATAGAPESGGSAGDQTAGDATGSLQIGGLSLTPAIVGGAPVAANTPVTILSARSGGETTAVGGGNAATGADGTSPSSPDSTASLQVSPGDDSTTGGDGDESTAGGGRDGAGPEGIVPGDRDGTVPSGDRDVTVPGDPSRGTLGEFQPNAGTEMQATRRSELGAPATAALPFTGVLVWIVALAGAVAMAIGTRGRRLTAA